MSMMENIATTRPLVNQNRPCEDIASILGSRFFILHMRVWIQCFTCEPSLGYVQVWHKEQWASLYEKAKQVKAGGGPGSRVRARELMEMAERHLKASENPRVGLMNTGNGRQEWVSQF